MKTLSYKNPWGYLVASGIKDIENRTWKLPEKYRGQRVLIHASAKPVRMKHESDVFTYKQWWHGLTYDQRVLMQSNTLTNSAIIGSIEIVDCVINHPSIWAEKRDGRLGSAKQCIEKPIYNWVLANPVLFAKPIPAKGKLSFWDFPMTEEEYFNLEKIGNPLSKEQTCETCTWLNSGKMCPKCDENWSEFELAK